MAKSLVIVESPAKAKTIKNYLGKDFSVEASSGHLIDLPKSKLGVDIDNDFQPQYEVIKNKKKYLTKLEKAAKKADSVYLASDPDREGEAIAWHIADQLGIQNKSYRILIHEITEKAIKESINSPTTLSMDKFDAQQARRVLDRLVGYQVSPLLWKKVRRGLSAGRVQSVALRLVVEREREIEKFVTKEYWSIEGDFLAPANGSTGLFSANLVRFEGDKIEIGTEEQAQSVVDQIKNNDYKVSSIERKERTKKAQPPFITSTLQQEASRKLRYPVKKTMAIAQKLYEGIELGAEGPMGLITYMRTDSVRSSDQALAESRSLIKDKYGDKYMPEKPNQYKVKKSAQDAHEAIRPTSFDYSPEKVKTHLADDEFDLYKLIWQRFLASQMTPIIYDQTTIEIASDKAVFRTTGSVIKFEGFSKVYTEGREEEEQSDEDEDKKLPDLKKDQDLNLKDLKMEQHFTQPPPRFSESSLVKELEEKGIGRPSTYSSIISTIQDREYVKREKRKLKPTVLGKSVNDMLIDGFPEILDVKFTADMEDKLDKVEEGDINWVELMKNFYKGFSERLSVADEKMRSLRRDGVPAGIDCNECGAPMIIKWGKRGEFLSCSKYPECKNAKPFHYDEDGNVKVVERVEPEVSDIECDKCGKPMVIRQSRYGKFYGCSGYPECKNIKRMQKEKPKEEKEPEDDSSENSKSKNKRKVITVST
ncbi:MAG: type I DNA topoisomerase [Candidatus Dadabacteria bacterium]|nr:type I DNA topoisomerase [Candidatus Dadabacteria bacterium]NIS08491.1 type I DNA topoisomerase [Candidatus Dadabacteria bacterium]NIV41632.1 type I DNA topoisomerase [Candidatus Dadabacteria bacterium]NIY21979.1 type I DNA topoisomerase [Candidatus Dadabacteria bacterium]